MNDQIGHHQRALIAQSINQLGFSLYRELASQSNLVFSPLGVYCVLRILLEGARGETRSAISQLLCQDSEPVSTEGFQSLVDSLQASSPGIHRQWDLDPGWIWFQARVYCPNEKIDAGAGRKPGLRGAASSGL